MRSRISTIGWLRLTGKAVRSLLVRTLALAGLLLASSLVFAQDSASTLARITGTVKDPSQAVLAGVQVVLTNVQTKAKLASATDSNGVYFFPGLHAGAYIVEIDAKGFKPIASSEINVTEGQTFNSDFALALAANTESVTVSAGSVENAYRVDTVKPGSPLGSIPILNLPYTINVISRQLIDDTQSRNFKEAAKYLPLVSFQETQGPEVLRPETRGFQGTNMQDDRKDGMGIAVTLPSAMEEYEQIEVFNGLGGSMYGPTNPSGIFNFVTKRPTDEPLRQVELQYEGATVATGHLDLGGRLGPDKMFGYRTNLLLGDGTGYVAGSQLRRQLAAVALDARPFANTMIEGNFSYYNVYQHGYPGWFAYNPVIYTAASSSSSETKSPYTMLPAQAPNPAVAGYGQTFSGVDLNNQIGEVRVNQSFGKNWHLIVGVLQQIADRNVNSVVNSMSNLSPTAAINSATYTPSTYQTYLGNEFGALFPRYQVKSDLGYMSGSFKTGTIRHDVIFGSTGYKFVQWSSKATPPKVVLCPAGETTCQPTFAAPLIDVPPTATADIDVVTGTGIPSYSGNSNLTHGIYISNVYHQQGFNFSDTITLTPHWVLRAAASQDWYWTNNYSAPPASNYAAYVPNPSINIDTQGVSPTGSVIYKPVSNMSIYATFAESLQAPDTPQVSTSSVEVINSGKALVPYHDTEGEIGYKLESHKLNFSSAIFRIERPFANENLVSSYTSGTTTTCGPVTLTATLSSCEIWEIIGNQLNYGVEAMLSGRVVESLMITGGISVLNPKLTGTGIAATNDKTFVGTPDYKSNILAEYHIPVLTGAFFNFDWQFVGRRWMDDVNTVSTPQYNTFDFGARYTTMVFGKLTTWRVTGNNLTNVHYWSTIGPGSITGQATSSYLGHLGEPRLVTASVRFDF
jgi:iron complex outermembrane receptor protein